MGEQLCIALDQNQGWIAAAVVALLVIEAWLGKTTKLKSGSILELLLKSLLAVRPKRKTKGEKNGKSV